MRTMEDLLAEFSSLGWAVSVVGMLRENAFGGKPREYYCAVYPDFFGKEVWWDTSRDGGYSIITPRFRGSGKSPEEAMAKALQVAEASSAKKLYARATKAMERCVEAHEAGTRTRAFRRKEREASGLEGL